MLGDKPSNALVEDAPAFAHTAAVELGWLEHKLGAGSSGAGKRFDKASESEAGFDGSPALEQLRLVGLALLGVGRSTGSGKRVGKRIVGEANAAETGGTEVERGDRGGGEAREGFVSGGEGSSGENGTVFTHKARRLALKAAVRLRKRNKARGSVGACIRALEEAGREL